MYTEIENVNEKIIASNGKDFFICQKDKNNYYSRYIKSTGLTVTSQDLDYIALGADKFKTIKTARNRIVK